MSTRVQNKRYFIRISYPWSHWSQSYGESHTDSLDYAKRAFKRWCDDIEEEGQSATVALVEMHVRVHRVVMVCPGQRIEMHPPTSETLVMTEELG